MILKGYPRISESFISSEILLLESLGLPIDIYSLRQPRETFTHDNVKQIKAPATYLPEYVWPHWRTLLDSNRALNRRLGSHYRQCLARALSRAFVRRKSATIRHFLQAGHLCATRLISRPIRHLHAHFCHTPTSVTLFAAELLNLPYSFTAHAKDIYTSEPEQLQRKIDSARFVVTCTGSNAKYLSALNTNSTPIHTIYHGIDLDFFRFVPSPPPSPPFRILSVGRLVPKKGYDDLLEALKQLQDRGLDFRFSHIGSGELEDCVRRRIHAIGLQEQVKLLGTLPRQEVLNHYQQSHCFVLASKVAANGDRDGIPNVLVEAMAVGLPVISTRVSAIPELVENGLSGILVEPANPKALADAMHSLLLNPQLHAGMVRRARRRVEQHFDNRRCVVRLHQLFQAALDG
ncbi:MAG TPA: colanic acid biosynthesis glycosyltransferase WcaL [Syntrophobacteraceae bacterium]|nr:colanic acid biosynthesis glycosyltransferase WcaL [Syntrophobacteraceae bacterium]